jgi:hypothetical protein
MNQIITPTKTGTRNSSIFFAKGPKLLPDWVPVVVGGFTTGGFFMIVDIYYLLSYNKVPYDLETNVVFPEIPEGQAGFHDESLLWYHAACFISFSGSSF